MAMDSVHRSPGQLYGLSIGIPPPAGCFCRFVCCSAGAIWGKVACVNLLVRCVRADGMCLPKKVISRIVEHTSRIHGSLAQLLRSESSSTRPKLRRSSRSPVMLTSHRFSRAAPGLLLIADGGTRMPMAAVLLCVLDFTSSIFPLARLMPGTTQSPQLHCMPCHAYLPTLDLHFGHSSRPSSLPCSNSGRIQESGSMK